MYLEEYARQHGLRNIRHFWDDGYTGTNFNRPGFNALLSEIEAGHVATLIVKGRFGRNYLQVGYYTEVGFPQEGCPLHCHQRQRGQRKALRQRLHSVPEHHERVVWQGHQQQDQGRVQGLDEERNAVQYSLWLQAD